MIEKGFYEISSAIIGGIIDYYYLIVIIILIEDGLKVVLVTIIFGIIACGDDNTNRQLLSEST